MTSEGRPSQARTIRREVRCTGIGLHSGRPVNLVLKPGATGQGVVFLRTDLDGAEIRAARANLTGISFATTLSQDGASVQTTEHLLSAVYALGIDNLIVELDGPELPILDGSAAPFVYLLHEAGLRSQSERRRYLRMLRPLLVSRDEKTIAVYPSDRLSVSYTIRFAHPLIGHQTQSFGIEPELYAAELAPARTFCFLRDVEALRQRGLALGGSLDNAIVLDDVSVLNEKLRFEDEFVRHKVLDVIGDLALLGHPLLGHVVAYRAGHALHAELVARILDTPGAWTLETVSESRPLPSAVRSLAPRPA